jgi:hypothetical protein
MSNNARIVRISTRTTGRSFGVVGVIKARNGREIATTEVCPLGMESSALRRAGALAESRGWIVE